MMPRFVASVHQHSIRTGASAGSVHLVPEHSRRQSCCRIPSRMPAGPWRHRTYLRAPTAAALAAAAEHGGASAGHRVLRQRQAHGAGGGPPAGGAAHHGGHARRQRDGGGWLLGAERRLQAQLLPPALLPLPQRLLPTPVRCVAVRVPILVGRWACTPTQPAEWAALHPCMNAACCVPAHCSEHVFLNKGIGATTSGIYAVCADKMLPEVRLAARAAAGGHPQPLPVRDRRDGPRLSGAGPAPAHCLPQDPLERRLGPCASAGGGPGGGGADLQRARGRALHLPAAPRF